MLTFSDIIEMFSHPQRGEVEEWMTQNQSGRVQFSASSYPARLYDEHLKAVLTPTSPVMVIGREGITLLIVPL